MMDVQIQSGGDDCGIFATAFAFALCSGRNPCNITFTQQLRQDHLSSCFHVQKLSPFPSDSKPRQALKDARNIEKFPVFCVCRMPKDKKGMAQCTACRDWFHQKCQKILRAVFTKKAIWRCISCTL